MIDLHCHTTYSDGTYSVKDILKEASKIELEVLSITDHNSVESYLEMENMDVNKLFKGKIICGCEFTTKFDNRLIEVLGYGIDYRKVNMWLKNRYNEEIGTKNVQTLFHRLVNIIDKIGLKYNYDCLHYPQRENDFFERSFYEEIIKYPENLEIIDENIFTNFSDFFRKGLTNKDSKLFLNAIEFKPSIDEVIKIIHECGGIALLAHPFQYKFIDTEDFLEKVINESKLDGIECFYTTFNEEQSKYLVQFTKENNLLISGGSDCHGNNKINHYLGSGAGNLNIDKSIINNWNIEYYK